MHVNIILIGHARSGKSVIAKSLAKETKLQLVDIEEEIEKSTGVSIDWIKELEGEDGLQKRGSKILLEASKMKGQVIAVCNAINVSPGIKEQLCSGSIIIYLGSDKERVIKEIKNKHGANQGVDELIKEIEHFFSHKEARYKSYADLSIDVLRHSMRSIVGLIIKEFIKN